MKFGIKVGAMLSSLVLALVCFIGCNADEPTPPATTGPGAASTGKPATTPATTTPAPKVDEKK